MRIKSEARRQAIVDVAAGVFRDTGFEAASMSEIAAKVGGSKATLYSYFTSKEELFVEVMSQSAESHMREIFEVLDPTADLRISLQAFGERLLKKIFDSEIVAVQRNAFAEAGKSNVGRLFYQRGPSKGIVQMSVFLEQCMKLGKMRQADASVAARHLIALLKAEDFDTVMFGIEEGISHERVPAIVQRAIEVFLRGYAPQAIE